LEGGKEGAGKNGTKKKRKTKKKKNHKRSAKGETNQNVFCPNKETRKEIGRRLQLEGEKHRGPGKKSPVTRGKDKKRKKKTKDMPTKEEG